MGLYRPPLAPALPPIGGMAHAMPWNYLYFRHSKLTSSNSVIAIWGRHGGRGESKKSVELYEGFPMKIALNKGDFRIFYSLSYLR
jgi:hypothetical protein